MDTYFAAPERLSGDDLQAEMETISRNPFIDSLLLTVSGLLAVLNEHRQILAVNDSLLDMLGIDIPAQALGLRPGEALQCEHACDMPGGCGTSAFCSSCGAAIGIVTSLATNQPVEKECAMVTVKGGRKRDLFFRVRCVPLSYNAQRVLLLFLQDITYQQRLASLDRVFFHEINGIIQGIQNVSYLISLRSSPETRDLAEQLARLTERMISEVSIQQCLNSDESCAYQPTITRITIAQVFQELKDVSGNHSAAKNKRLSMPDRIPELVITTDRSLVLRVLGNMITNAFEATDEGDEVRLWAEAGDRNIAFCVWNRKAIPAETAKRIFQRNFSTKAQAGRGLGTYSMKLFGEEALGGSVQFTSSDADGTVFRFSLSA